MKPKVAILFTDGINREQETQFAFSIAGAKPEVIHLNSLFAKEKNLSDYQILCFPGGFSYGDDVMSAKIWSNMMLHRLKDDVEEFAKKDKLILGICNGFQALLRLGLLPYNKIGNIDAALIPNDSGKFESRFIKLRIEESNCIFTKDMAGRIIEIPCSHGEGKFIAKEDTLKQLEENKQIVFRYINNNGHATQNYPNNPNGSLNAICGICDESGKIMGLMPHPECHVKLHQHPNWNEFGEKGSPHARGIFENAVKYFSEK